MELIPDTGHERHRFLGVRVGQIQGLRQRELVELLLEVRDEVVRVAPLLAAESRLFVDPPGAVPGLLAPPSIPSPPALAAGPPSLGKDAMAPKGAARVSSGVTGWSGGTGNRGVPLRIRNSRKS